MKKNYEAMVLRSSGDIQCKQFKSTKVGSSRIPLEKYYKKFLASKG
jgi:hypothetical protein